MIATHVVTFAFMQFMKSLSWLAKQLLAAQLDVGYTKMINIRTLQNLVVVVMIFIAF